MTLVEEIEQLNARLQQRLADLNTRLDTAESLPSAVAQADSILAVVEAAPPILHYTLTPEYVLPVEGCPND